MTLNKKHTPGPWGMPDSGQGRISKVGVNGGWDGMVATADCGDYARSRSEGLANARLIAATPDLLAALQAIVDEAGPQFGHDEEPGCINRMARLARLAIAKATGGANA